MAFGARPSRTFAANARTAAEPWFQNAGRAGFGIGRTLSKRDCDSWHEPETVWHRAWKDNFPTDWQEISLRAPSGEIHRADVKTKGGCVIEFQHSPLSVAERQSRENFYGNMVWVIDGLRTKRAKRNFFDALRSRRAIDQSRFVYVVALHECSILEEWSGSGRIVFFDFGEWESGVDLFANRVLWNLSPKSPKGQALLQPIPVETFIKELSDGSPFQERVIEVPVPRQSPQPLSGFQRHMALMQRRRRRF
jgi:competence protein CoiA